MINKVLITGGNGFIGQYVAENLKAKGLTPVIFDHKNSVTTDFLGDTRDYTAVSEAVATVDGVIHLAGVLGTQETISKPLPAVETNIIGGLNIFEAIKHYKKPCVYIAVGNHWMNNSYSITKTTAERFAFMYNREHGTKIAVVRGLNVYGPRQKYEPVRKIMPNLILPSLKDEAITIYGDGSQVMDMIYVEDIAEILVRALLLNHGNYSTVFEAGTGRLTTVKEIAEEVIKQVGQGSINYVDMRPGEPPHSTVVGNPDTLKPLGTFSFTTLEDGISKTIPYYKKLSSK